MKINDLPSWRALTHHYQQIHQHHLRDWFANDPDRFANFSVTACELVLDYSKNRITRESLKLLIDFAHECDLSQKIDDLFLGKPVNVTQQCAALHTALRNVSGDPVYVDGCDVMIDINAALEKMREISNKIRDGVLLGSKGDRVTDVVNIGIGGSNLGAVLACDALQAYASDSVRMHFLSNIDPEHFYDVISKIDRYKTIFIVSSKSFTTIETLTNAREIKSLYANDEEIRQHFFAVTAEISRAENFGIDREKILPIWEWVGGRYSMWSAIGLPIAIAIGFDNFQEMLRGAFEMDQHFRHTRFDQNIPVILALLGVWYSNFFGCQTQAVIPYSHRLRHLPSHLMQLVMESNGKRISQLGESVPYATSPIIWGEVGCSGQHAFHQLLHQGTHVVPIDFIAIAHATNRDARQDMLLSSCLSQSQALSFGNSHDHDDTDFAYHPGNQPSNTLLLSQLTPATLGTLIAMYEHKTYVQSCLWNINAFDQPGVALGKQLSQSITERFASPTPHHDVDSSTAGLMALYLAARNRTS